MNNIPPDMSRTGKIVLILIFMLLCATVVSAITSVTKSTGTQNIMYINGLYDDNGVTAFFGKGCSANEYVSAISEIGDFTCGADTWDISGVLAGAGLINGGLSGDVTLNVGAGTCIDANVDDVQVEADCITGTQLADTIALDADLAVTGYNVSIDSPTFFVDASNNRVGVGIATPAVTFDVDSNSNSQGMRLRGADAPNEIGDIFMDSSGQFVFSTIASTDSASFIEFRPKSSSFGIVMRESDGTSTTTPYANFYVMDAAADYLNIVLNAATSTTGLVVTDEEYVGIGTTTPGGEFEIYNPASTSGADDEFRISSNVTGVGDANGFSMAFATGTGILTMTNEGDIFIKAGDTNSVFIQEGGYSGSHTLASFADGSIIFTEPTAIGADSVPANTLDVVGSSSSYIAMFENTYSAASDGIRIQLDDLTLGSGNDFIEFFDSASAQIGDIDCVAGTMNYRGFRGAHYADYDYSDEISAGMVVVSINEITPNTPNMPKVALTDKKDDERAYGVWDGFEEEYNGMGTEGKIGTVSAIGDSSILVTDLGGDLEVGSLLTTSGRKGFAQRQDDDLIHSYTLAKARRSVDWDDVEIDPNFGFKTARIPCTLFAG